jgi:hypothetical protein
MRIHQINSAGGEEKETLNLVLLPQIDKEAFVAEKTAGSPAGSPNLSGHVDVRSSVTAAPVGVADCRARHSPLRVTCKSRYRSLLKALPKVLLFFVSIQDPARPFQLQNWKS